MSNNKQSSVEWFAHESWKLRVELEDGEDGKISMGEYANKYYQLEEQAKAMHKEEIIEARIDGDTWSTAIKEMRRNYAELYYNETFGCNNEQQ